MDQQKRLLLEILEKLANDAKYILDNTNHDKNRFILLLLLEKIVDRSTTIAFLVDEGKVEDGAILLRVLIEQVIQFKLCCDDAINIDFFISDAEHNFVKFFNLMEKNNALSKTLIDQCKKYESNIKGSNKRIWKLARDADLYDLYLYLYKDLSDYVHNSFLNLLYKLSESEDVLADKKYLNTVLIETLGIVKTCVENKRLK